MTIFAILIVLTLFLYLLLGILRLTLVKRVLAPSPQVFISYRRTDSEQESNSLYRELQDAFGIGAVFLDTSSIEAGSDFPDEIVSRIHNSDVVVVVMDDQWEHVKLNGVPRITLDTDWVRKEIRLALDLKKPLIPIRVNKREMPKADSLPEDIRKFVNKASWTLDQTIHFRQDVERIKNLCRKFAKLSIAGNQLFLSEFATFVILAAALAFLGIQQYNLLADYSTVVKSNADISNSVSDHETRIEAEAANRAKADLQFLPGTLAEIRNAHTTDKFVKFARIHITAKLVSLDTSTITFREENFQDYPEITIRVDVSKIPVDSQAFEIRSRLKVDDVVEIFGTLNEFTARNFNVTPTFIVPILPKNLSCQ